ncbi:MAG TPA: hypothetical protein VK882_02820 [Nitrososphaeraceae archaeon]|jgi:hypothetical protein|nr:hypothetical protein [Nitrososphaeraceae archaeon]
MDNKNSCDSHGTAYRKNKSFEECKEMALLNSNLLSSEIKDQGEVSWTRVLTVANNDELVYKLTLKYLRQRGFNIGNNKTPRVK